MLIQQSTHLPKLLEFGIRPERRRQNRGEGRENGEGRAAGWRDAEEETEGGRKNEAREREKRTDRSRASERERERERERRGALKRSDCTSRPNQHHDDVAPAESRAMIGRSLHSATPAPSPSVHLQSLQSSSVHPKPDGVGGWG